MGSDTRVFLACSAASSSAFRFWPTSDVLQDKGDWLYQPGDKGKARRFDKKDTPPPTPNPCQEIRTEFENSIDTLVFCLFTHFIHWFYNYESPK